VTPDTLNKIRVDMLNMSQAELAEALGVKPLAISRWENGHRAIPPYLHLALAMLEVRGSRSAGPAGLPPHRT